MSDPHWTPGPVSILSDLILAQLSEQQKAIIKVALYSCAAALDLVEETLHSPPSPAPEEEAYG